MRARLIYRRSFRALVDAKQWTLDGHGQPLADLVGPDYGHLMESAEASVAVGGPWSTLGSAKAGTFGAPVLTGVGPFSADSLSTLVLSHAPPGAAAQAVIGLSQLVAPFSGGVLVPSPDVIVPLIAGLTGGATLGFPWRANLPAGLDIYYQMWIADAGASFGLAASNGLRSTSQDH